MAKLGQSYNVDQLPEDDAFTPLPDGWYLAKIAKSALTETKDGTGSFIDNQWEILGPTHQGRLVFNMMTIENNGPKKDVAERIGQQQLGSLMRATGLTVVDDTNQLIGVECEIKLGMEKPRPGYEARNELKTYRAPAGSARPPMTGFGKPGAGKPSAAMPASMSTGTTAPPPTERKAAPWDKK